MSFTEAIQSGFANYANFTGRALRSEYWYWVLFVIVADIVGSIVDKILFPGLMDGMRGSGPISALIGLVLLLPGLAVGARRLHDIDRSGWWLLLGLIPIIGWIVLIVWFATLGTLGPNRYGQLPTGAQTA